MHVCVCVHTDEKETSAYIFKIFHHLFNIITSKAQQYTTIVP